MKPVLFSLAPERAWQAQPQPQPPLCEVCYPSFSSQSGIVFENYFLLHVFQLAYFESLDRNWFIYYWFLSKLCSFPIFQCIDFCLYFHHLFCLSRADFIPFLALLSKPSVCYSSFSRVSAQFHGRHRLYFVFALLSFPCAVALAFVSFDP